MKAPEERFPSYLQYLLASFDEARTDPKRGLLDVIMPNGGRMRDCTGEEVGAVGRMLELEAKRKPQRKKPLRA